MAQITEIIMTAYERLQKLITDGDIYTKSQLDEKLDEIETKFGTEVAAAVQQKIDDGSLAELTIGNDTITTEKIVDGAITSNKIGTGAAIQAINNMPVYDDGTQIKFIDNVFKNNSNTITQKIMGKVKQKSTSFRDISEFTFANVNGTSYSYVDTPEGMSKTSVADKTLKVTIPIHTESQTSSNYRTTWIYLSTYKYDFTKEQTLYVEVKHDCVTDFKFNLLIYLQNRAGENYKSYTKTLNVLKTNTTTLIKVKIPSQSQETTKLKFSLYTAELVTTKFNLYVSRFALIEGNDILTEIPFSSDDYYAELQSTIKDITPLELPSIKAYIDGINTTKTAITDISYPKYIYTVANDIPKDEESARQYSACVYLDHLIKDVDNSCKIKGQNYGTRDKFVIASQGMLNGSKNINKGVNFYEEDKIIELESDRYTYPAITIKHRSTKASAGKTIFPKVLFLGDSITYGVGANSKYGDNVKPFWAYTRELFEMDKIDAGNNAETYNFKSLGSFITAEAIINYKGVNKNIICSADGFPTWGLNGHLHYSSLKQPSQANWDLLGLGNGSGVDYKGTPEQKLLYATTNEIYVGNPINPFFDNDKAGAIKFSIAKWLERYRTCDDNGDKLAFGDSNLGTKILTQSRIDKIDVCMPTHIIVQHGTNDLAQVGTEAFIANLKLLIADINANYPNVYIGIAFPDQAGTYFRDRYPEFIEDNITLSTTRINYRVSKRLEEEFNNMENQKVYLIPNYYTQPTAYAYSLNSVNSQNENLYRKFANMPEIHCGEFAHRAWAYQVYSWLKYTMTL